MENKYICFGEMWLWRSEDPLAKAAWHFFTIESEIANKIYFENSLKNMHKSRGFGSVKVKVQIGASTWETSIFPNKKENTFLLPIKASIRKQEDLKLGNKFELVLFIK